MAEEKRKPGKWTPKKDFHPGGQKGKLHRALGVPEGEKIPQEKLDAAKHSRSRDVRDMAIRAETMKGWHHGDKKRRGSVLYTHPRSNRHG